MDCSAAKQPLQAFGGIIISYPAARTEKNLHGGNVYWPEGEVTDEKVFRSYFKTVW